MTIYPPECPHCLFYYQTPEHRCTLYPDGIEGSYCLDYRPAASPESAGTGDVGRYLGEVIHQPEPRLSPREMLEYLGLHPAFTGYCPQYGYEFLDRERA